VRSKSNPITLGSVSLGARFVFRAEQLLGPECVCRRKPPFEGQVLTVVGFRPRYVNQVVLRDPHDVEMLLPLHMVEKALKIEQCVPDMGQ
jgi:hypothetical protein